MCYGHPHRRSLPPDHFTPSRTHRTLNDNALAVEELHGRLAETEARLERARAREAELSRRLEEMKRFVLVMEILETYLKRRFREQQEQLSQLFSSLPKLTLLFTLCGGDRKPGKLWHCDVISAFPSVLADNERSILLMTLVSRLLIKPLCYITIQVIAVTCNLGVSLFG
ncbi:protein SKIP34-like [Pistacia vera]|uniref:protein SKIP34-like n=1 Tax=Pistacia vera TaxID=55513 RepID=UPI0012630DB7|nr:protein SKIP34-like [Pistacia vera]